MNERIERLLEQSGLQPYYDAQEGQIEKFAELIVRECAAMTRNLSPHGEFAEKVVKEHFGVKE